MGLVSSLLVLFEGEEADVGVQWGIQWKRCVRGGQFWVLFICLCAMGGFLLGMDSQH